MLTCLVRVSIPVESPHDLTHLCTWLPQCALSSTSPRSISPPSVLSFRAGFVTWCVSDSVLDQSAPDANIPLSRNPLFYNACPIKKVLPSPSYISARLLLQPSMSNPQHPKRQRSWNFKPQADHAESINMATTPLSHPWAGLSHSHWPHWFLISVVAYI